MIFCERPGDSHLYTLINPRLYNVKTKISSNKKVLLREGKRHTAHRVASARGVPTLAGVLTFAKVGTYLGSMGTYLRVPPSSTPILTWQGVPTLDGRVPTLGYPLPIFTWLGGTYLVWGGTYLGVLPPPSPC